MIRHVLPLAIVLTLAWSAPADAQAIGTFRWHLAPFGSVMVLNVTQQGAIYTLHGYEEQCSNPRLPVFGVAVPQANGSVTLGLTTIMLNGWGLHTEASISPENFNGTWRDNANESGALTFSPGNVCPGGPRVNPNHPDPTPQAGTLQDLLDEIAALRARVTEIEGRKQ